LILSLERDLRVAEFVFFSYCFLPAPRTSIFSRFCLAGVGEVCYGLGFGSLGTERLKSKLAEAVGRSGIGEPPNSLAINSLAFSLSYMGCSS